MNISLEEIKIALKENISAINLVKVEKGLSFKNISIDTRTMAKNDLFIAIKGSRVDGHAFIDEAIKKGAKLIISESHLPDDIPYICVNDTTVALGKIASFYAKTINPIIIGITGTNGKSSVTNMVKNILSIHKPTLGTYQNYNNEIGLPLSILNAKPYHKYFVLEMGASKKGDISQLIKIANPTIVSLLNVSEAHLDSFKDLDTIVETKEEILINQGVKKIVILSLDNNYYERWLSKSKENKVITISLTKEADYSLQILDNDYILIKTPYEDPIKILIKERQSYFLENILFATAISCEAGAKSIHVTKGLDNKKIISGRFDILSGINGSKIIDSTYNANPLSFISTMDSLVVMEGAHWVIMGEMGELGPNSEQYHLKVANHAKDIGIDKLFVISKHSQGIKKIFGKNTYEFDSSELLLEFIKPKIHNNLNILVKASRFMKFEAIVDALVSD